ncbi:MAG: flagellar basal body rod protein FlgC [Bryobacteraceae bacterium]|jgi:flagellar basal-body rod protein FlgC
MSLFSLLSVSASGMAAQRTRAELVIQNLANSETTRTPEGGPYRRQDAVFESAPQVSPFSAVFQTEMTSGVNGVQVADIIQDPSEGEKRYQPGHPDADQDGFVAYPNVNPSEDMVDLLSAQRGYEGNVAAMTAIKDMIQRSIDLMK